MSITPTKPTNSVGTLGLSMVVVGTLFSPTGFCLFSLPFVFMLGFGGLAICGVSLLWRPRWPGIVGLIIGVLCVAVWVHVFTR